jgi:hypothetical protein
MPPSVASRHLPLKGGGRTPYAAASCCRLEAQAVRLPVEGDERRGWFPVSPLEGEVSATLTEEGESHGRLNCRENAHVH